jgi:hypothetical protein
VQRLPVPAAPRSLAIEKHSADDAASGQQVHVLANDPPMASPQTLFGATKTAIQEKSGITQSRESGARRRNADSETAGAKRQKLTSIDDDDSDQVAAPPCKEHPSTRQQRRHKSVVATKTRSQSKASIGSRVSPVLRVGVNASACEMRRRRCSWLPRHLAAAAAKALEAAQTIAPSVPRPLGVASRCRHAVSETSTAKRQKQAGVDDDDSDQDTVPPYQGDVPPGQRRKDLPMVAKGRAGAKAKVGSKVSPVSGVVLNALSCEVRRRRCSWLPRHLPAAAAKAVTAAQKDTSTVRRPFQSALPAAGVRRRRCSWLSRHQASAKHVVKTVKKLAATAQASTTVVQACAPKRDIMLLDGAIVKAVKKSTAKSAAKTTGVSRKPAAQHEVRYRRTSWLPRHLAAAAAAVLARPQTGKDAKQGRAARRPTPDCQSFPCTYGAVALQKRQVENNVDHEPGGAEIKAGQGVQQNIKKRGRPRKNPAASPEAKSVPENSDAPSKTSSSGCAVAQITDASTLGTPAVPSACDGLTIPLRRQGFEPVRPNVRALRMGEGATDASPVGRVRIVPRGRRKLDQSAWACAQCTLLNPNSTKQCQACEASKPVATKATQHLHEPAF